MGSNPISSAGEPLPEGRGSLLHLIQLASLRRPPEAPSLTRYFVKVEVEVEADDRRLVPVELEGRLLDGATRPPGLRVENATVVAVYEEAEGEED